MRYQQRIARAQPIASTTPRLFSSLAQRLSAFTQQEQNELDRDMAKKAKQKGLVDAQGKTDIILRDGTTIADEAWNQGAISSHLAAVKLDANENLTRIAAESKREPDAYLEKAKAYSQGLLEGVPEQIKPVVQDELASTILNTNIKIASDLASFERDQQGAQTATAIDLYRTEAANKAQEGDIEGATDAQLKAIQLSDSLELSGLLTPQAAETQRNDITREIEDQLIYGEFSRNLMKGDAVKFITKFKSVKQLGGRDPNYRKKMTDKMIKMMADSHAIEDAQVKRETIERKEVYRSGEKEVVTADLAGDLTIEFIQELLKEDRIDPKVADKYKKAAFLEGPEFSLQSELNLVRADLLDYPESEIQTNEDLSRTDRDKLVNERRRLEEDAENWKNTQNGREGARRINHAFGIIKGVDIRISEEKARRAGTVLTRYFNEIESLPLEEREIKSIEISDRLVKEVNSEINVADLEKAQERLTRSPYQNIEQIKAAELGTEEEKTQIKQLERKLRQIERLQRGQ